MLVQRLSFNTENTEHTEGTEKEVGSALSVRSVFSVLKSRAFCNDALLSTPIS